MSLNCLMAFANQYTRLGGYSILKPAAWPSEKSGVKLESRAGSRTYNYSIWSLMGLKPLDSRANHSGKFWH